MDYRHKSVKRLNIPPAGLTARGEIVREKKVRYAYNPHLSPVLRFDATGKADSIEKLIEDASRRKLEPHEIKLLQEALRNHEPWLEWAGKREQQWCVADPVALHIHERISTQAILRVAKRQDVQRDLFADPEQEVFYWLNIKPQPELDNLLCVNGQSRFGPVFLTSFVSNVPKKYRVNPFALKLAVIQTPTPS